MNAARPPRYFEDHRDGEIVQLGHYEVTEAEIIEFARRFDPQPFHVDAEAARESHFGGLVASGWMTGSIMMRLLVDGFISPASSMGSPGLDKLRWIKPVRPGDVLHGRVTILQTRRSESKPDRGLILTRHELTNQDGDLVYQAEAWGMYKRRPESGTEAADRP